MASEIKYCAKCERCHDDGLRDDEDCEYYGEPCGCNHPNRGFAESANETIAEIVKEMRIFKCRNLASGELENCVTTQHYFADRIEAAHRREVAELKLLHDIHAKQAIRDFNRELFFKDKLIAELRKALEGVKDEGK